MENNYMICHKFWDHKNRRLSIYGRFNESANVIVIHVFSCSKKDTFSRKRANRCYSKGMPFIMSCLISKTIRFKGHDVVRKVWKDQPAHPDVVNLPTTSETYKRDFLNYCHENFFVKDDMVVGVENCNQVIFADVFYNSNTHEVRTANVRVKKVSDDIVQQNNEYLKEIDTSNNNFSNRLTDAYNIVQT